MSITSEQKRIEMEKEKSTRASKGSSNIATYLLPKIYSGHSMEMSIFLSPLSLGLTLGYNYIYIYIYIYIKIKQCFILNNYTSLSHQCGNICF